MKTQISRDAFQPKKNYSGVYLQQGRMITDADWNELTDIAKERLTDSLRDVISGTDGGAPRTGGLKITQAGDGRLYIDPGVLYVEGVPARLHDRCELATQPDYPINVAAVDVKNLWLYADVWERTVTALEDDRLMDAALHGADTATRTQTMLQIKWRHKQPGFSKEPLPKGNSLLTLTLHKSTSSSDSCDPCASQVNIDQRTGNYLFRVEVHDYSKTSDNEKLTLKWSSDNGAEICKLTEMPANFTSRPGALEFFDSRNERLLGRHFVGENLRGIMTKATNASNENHGKEFVRQWDGYLTIDLNDGKIIHGCDFDKNLEKDQGNAHGSVEFDSGNRVMVVNLERIKLTLDAKDKQFFPGDYWLASVREAVHGNGSELLSNEMPKGVIHHYLFLGETNKEGVLIRPDKNSLRRMSFPPLSDIGADDVGYSVEVECRSRIDLWKDLETVKDALDTICCKFNASHLPLKQGSTSCSPAKTVQDALDNLCRNSSKCCAILADQDNLHDLLTNFSTAHEDDLWICLRGGEYTLKDMSIIEDAKHSLRICGQGAQSTTILLNSPLVVKTKELLLENLSFVFEDDAQLKIMTSSSRTNGCKFSRKIPGEETTAAMSMISVAGLEEQAVCSLAWCDNFLSAKKGDNMMPDWALRLENAWVGGNLVNNKIDGWMLLNNNGPLTDYHASSTRISAFDIKFEGDVIESSGEELRLEGNRITAVKANLPVGSREIDANGRMVMIGSVQGYARAFFAFNSILKEENSMAAKNFVGQGNAWTRHKGNFLGFVIAERAVFTGNLLEESVEIANFPSTINKDLLASTGNMKVDILPRS